MTTEAKQTVALSLTVRICLIAVGVLGVFGITITFVFFDASTNQIEAWLLHRFPASKSDAFRGLNGLMNPWVISLWICWSILLPVSWISRRYVSFVALMVAPMMPAAGLLLFDFDFADPNWFVLFASTTIGVFVGTISAIVLFVLPRRAHVIKIR